MIEDKIAKGRTMHLHSDLLIVSVVFPCQRLLWSEGQKTDDRQLKIRRAFLRISHLVLHFATIKVYLIAA
jgi:hypothetical protein